MNAKVKIQLSKPSIPLYSATHVLNACTLVYEAENQLRTLFNQINKATKIVKTYIKERGFDSSSFTEIENLIVISIQLSDIKIEDVSNYKGRIKDINKQYDAGDLHDFFELAHESITWLDTLCLQIKSEINTAKEALKENIHAYVFSDIERLINITEYFAESNANTFNVESDRYKQEWEAANNG
ncbi:hypothetical protein [Acinetobacter baumannii]|uniref:hypothetical protein n=1 Tax=Acinetobacter baumannii TaxID=470 RepID=UPI00202320C9|nr:hypothetical protein [Acinetobacter baumannii]MCL8264259.1 hypothetical protein [Acinetobacter baumannii]